MEVFLMSFFGIGLLIYISVVAFVRRELKWQQAVELHGFALLADEAYAKACFDTTVLSPEAEEEALREAWKEIYYFLQYFPVMVWWWLRDKFSPARHPDY